MTSGALAADSWLGRQCIASFEGILGILSNSVVEGCRDMTTKAVLIVVLGACLLWTASVSAQVMRMDINGTLSANVTSDPYCDAVTTGSCSTTSFCTSTRATVTTMPTDAVDWVLVEIWGILPGAQLETIADSAGACLVRKSALLLNNGRLVDPTRVNASTNASSCGAVTTEVTTCPGIRLTEVESAFLGGVEDSSSLHLVIRHRNHVSVLFQLCCWTNR